MNDRFVPSITLDSKHPGLMGIGTPGHGPVTYLDREQAERFAMDIIATAQQGFMRHAPDRIIGYTAFECERDMAAQGMHCANPEEHAS